MKLYYIRHGEPVYQPNILTPLGERQAEAVARMLIHCDIDEIYASTSQRAIDTAQPTADILRKEIETFDFCSDDVAWKDFCVQVDGRNTWLWSESEMRKILSSPEVMALGQRWYEHPALAEFKPAMDKAKADCAGFMSKLGYDKIDGAGQYVVREKKEHNVALFAHGGYSKVFLSAILDIPFPIATLCFDMCHSGVTVIEFTEENGIAIPKVLMHSADSHIYKEGLVTYYC